MYNHIKAYREQKVEWDEIREQQVYRALSRRRAAHSGKRMWKHVAAGGAIAATLIAGVMGILHIGAPSGDAFEQHGPIASPKGDPVTQSLPSDTSERTSVLTLASAGQVTLMDGAEVSIVQQQEDTVILEQVAGQALYSIVHRDGRIVQVRVSDIVITVVGTEFLVTLDEAVARIDVKHGVVRVDDGKQIVTLETSETISMAISPQTSIGRRSLKHRTGRKKARREVARPEELGVADAEDLFYEVDRARRNGDLEKAAGLLRRIVAGNESPFSVASAEFTLGKVERARGRHAAAARAFHQCAKHASHRPLGQDALAEAALSWQAAGVIKTAQMIARHYLEDYPDGMYVVQMKRLIE